MMKIQLILVALGSLLLGMTEASAEQKLYRWVDNEGLVHYSDHVPPAFANQDLDILNDHGIAVDHVDHAASEEELAERAQLAAVKEAEDEAAREQARIDSVLLATYLSVEDIVRLRDQRLELLEAQADVTEQYLRSTDNFDYALSQIPMGRFGKPGDIVGTALLLGSQAGVFITGQTIFVDGGRTCV